MSHKVKEIIENQNAYKSDIREWLHRDFQKSRKKLSEIEETDDVIKTEKKRLTRKVKSINVKKFVESLFFISNKRSRKFYVLWDVDKEEAVIYKYAVKERRKRKAPSRH